MSVHEIKGQLAHEAGNLKEIAGTALAVKLALEHMSARLHTAIGQSANPAVAEALAALGGVHEHLGSAAMLLLEAQHDALVYEEKI